MAGGSKKTNARRATSGRRGAPTPDDYERAAELRRGLQAFLRSSERVTRKHGLTTERYQLMLLVKLADLRGETATVGGLATALDLAKSTVTQLVRRAENLRLVRRELSDRDARIRYLRLTAEGERRLEAALVELNEDRAHLLQLVTALEPLQASTPDLAGAGPLPDRDPTTAVADESGKATR